MLYEYDNGEIREVTNQREISNRNRAGAKYLPNYKVEVSYGLDEKYIIDISLKDKSYLDLIYDEKGEVKLETIMGISDINVYYEIKEYLSEKYVFLIRQNIIGIVLADILGVVQSKISFNLNGEFYIKSREVILGRGGNLGDRHN